MPPQLGAANYEIKDQSSKKKKILSRRMGKGYSVVQGSFRGEKRLGQLRGREVGQKVVR